MAGLYRTIGQYERAEPLFIEAKNIKEKTFGKNHPDYAIGCNNLAIFYKDMGQYEKAKSLFIESKNIKEKELKPVFQYLKIVLILNILLSGVFGVFRWQLIKGF